MEYIVIIVVSIITIILLKIGLNIRIKDIKKVKEIGYDKELNTIANKFPENKEICENILKKLNNTDVKIEEDNKANSIVNLTYNNFAIYTAWQLRNMTHEDNSPWDLTQKNKGIFSIIDNEEIKEYFKKEVVE